MDRDLLTTAALWTNDGDHSVVLHVLDETRSFT
jgi:hypothetical protein